MTAEAPKIRPAFDTLRELRDGACLDELATELNRLTEAVQRTGRGGNVTLTISVKRAANSQIAMVVIDDIKSKLPVPEKSATIMFATEQNNLQSEHPKQTKLPLHEVEPPAPAREAKAK